MPETKIPSNLSIIIIVVRSNHSKRNELQTREPNGCLALNDSFVISLVCNKTTTEAHKIHMRRIRISLYALICGRPFEKEGFWRLFFILSMVVAVAVVIHICETTFAIAGYNVFTHFVHHRAFIPETDA